MRRARAFHPTIDMEISMLKTLTLCAGLSLAALPTYAQDSHSGMDHSAMDMNVDAMAEAVHAEAVVNTIGETSVNVSHGPIPEIGWPPMTMDMPLVENAEVADGISEGDTVTIMLMKGDDGMYGIAAMTPKE